MKFFVTNEILLFFPTFAHWRMCEFSLHGVNGYGITTVPQIALPFWEITLLLSWKNKKPVFLLTSLQIVSFTYKSHVIRSAVQSEVPETKFLSHSEFIRMTKSIWYTKFYSGRSPSVKPLCCPQLHSRSSRDWQFKIVQIPSTAKLCRIGSYCWT